MIYQERVYRSCECSLFFQPKQHYRSKEGGDSITNEREVGVGLFVCFWLVDSCRKKKKKKWLQSLSHSFVRKIDSSMYKFVFRSFKLVFLACMSLFMVFLFRLKLLHYCFLNKNIGIQSLS